MNNIDRQFNALTEGMMRVVYLRPRNVGDEAIAVGVVYQCNDKIEVVTVESVSAYEALRCLQGDYAVDGTIAALGVLKSYVENSETIDLVSPSSNLMLGEVKGFFSENSREYARDYLYLSSSLLQERKKSAVQKKVSQSDIAKELYKEVSHINVIAATKLFDGYKIKTKRNRSISFPIFGDRIIGAPISMTSSKVASSKTLAEAYCAKFVVAREYVNRKPSLYVLAPSFNSKDVNMSLIEDSLGELEMVADANDIAVRVERNTIELARAILLDESA